MSSQRTTRTRRAGSGLLLTLAGRPDGEGRRSAREGRGGPSVTVIANFPRWAAPAAPDTGTLPLGPFGGQDLAVSRLATWVITHIRGVNAVRRTLGACAVAVALAVMAGCSAGSHAGPGRAASWPHQRARLLGPGPAGRGAAVRDHGRPGAAAREDGQFAHGRGGGRAAGRGAVQARRERRATSARRVSSPAPGEDLLVTAAHCIHGGKGARLQVRHRLHPRVTRTARTPFGVWTPRRPARRPAVGGLL